MPGSIGSSVPGTRANPAKQTSPSGPAASEGGSSGGGSSGPSDTAGAPTVPKAGTGQDGEEGGPPPSVIRRAQLPPPSEVQDEKVYMATLKSGNTVPMTGRELKDTLTTDQPPPGALTGGLMQTATSNGSSNGSADGSSGEEGNKWWQDVLLGIGRIGGIFLRDRLGDGEELTEEEREALRRIAERRRRKRQRRQRRNRWLLIGGVALVGGLGLWFATRSSGAPAPPPPPPPEDEPTEPGEVEITDTGRSNPHGAPPQEAPSQEGAPDTEDPHTEDAHMENPHEENAHAEKPADAQGAGGPSPNGPTA